MEKIRLPISKLRMDGGTQPRAEIDHELIEEYSQMMLAGIVFDAVDAFYDGTDYWVGDGFHRLRAADRAEVGLFDVVVHQGTVRDAKWFSFRANRQHGLRRKTADVKRIIQEALQHENSAEMSDTALAKHIGCSQSWVSEIHRAMEPHPSAGSGIAEPVTEPKKRTVTRAGVTYQQRVAQKSISGRSAASPVSGPGNGVPAPKEAGSPAITVPEFAGEAGRPKQRTYHPVPGSEPADEQPVVGIAGSIKLVTAAREGLRASLGDDDYDYLSVDLPAIELLERAGESFTEHARKARERLIRKDSRPAERVAIH